MMLNNKKALIIGVSGQDGAYLARFLIEKGYKVFGTSRDAAINNFKNLERIGIKSSINIFSMSIVDFRSILQVITKIEPDEIYNLSGQTSVGLSFSQPVEANESINLGTLNLLEVIRYVNPKIKFYNAGSSEIFGETGKIPADENSPYRPQSPYAVAKAAAAMQVSVYRDAYGLNACTGILFNHESPLRPDRFVTKKIVKSISRIIKGSTEKLMLGNLEIIRDWGWAPEYVEAMWLMLQKENMQDYIISTGTSASLRDFVRIAFEHVNLDWKEFVLIDQDLVRISDPKIITGNPFKAATNLGWEAQIKSVDVIKKMLINELEATIK
jgi:GDPmannose 4,6-dehydratase